MIPEDSTHSASLLASIINFSDDAIISIDATGKITSWNRGAEKMLGYSENEMIGKHASDLILPEVRKEEMDFIAKIRGGDFVEHLETEWKKKSGEGVYISLTLSPIKSNQGDLLGILKIGRDITIRKRAEEIQSRMADIINFSDDAIITKTLEGIITSWNRGAEKIFGYTRQEVLGKHISLLIPADRSDEEPAIIEKVRKGEYIDHYETIRQRKDGTKIHISLTVSPIVDGGGVIRGVSKIARDITLRKKNEEIVHLLSSIVSSSDDAILSTTVDGVITSWNRGAEAMYGYTEKEVLGKHISILIPPGRLDEEPQIIQKVSAGEHIHHYETVRVRKDGSQLPISLSVSPINDANGRIVGVSKIGRDISLRRKAEETVHRLAAIVNHSDDAIISKNLDGTITSWNNGASRIFGYSSAEAIGQNIMMLIPAELAAEEHRIIEKIRRGESVEHYETTRRKKDGTMVPISLTISPVRNSEGEVIGASKIARDVSEKRKWETEILELNKEMEAFSYSVSHDLKAPLRRIISYAQILDQDFGHLLNDDARKVLDKMLKNSVRMSNLVEKLLMFSQLGRKSVTSSSVNMDDLVKETLHELVAAENGREVSVIVNPLERVYGDAELLRHVWENLLSNALKYSRKKQKTFIEVGSTANDSAVVYHVRDNGAGFDMQYAANLFNAFQRLHSNDDFEGSGIGLAIVARIVSRHGGKVWAEGKPDEGATFYFSLPRSPEQ